MTALALFVLTFRFFAIRPPFVDGRMEAMYRLAAADPFLNRAFRFFCGAFVRNFMVHPLPVRSRPKSVSSDDRGAPIPPLESPCEPLS